MRNKKINKQTANAIIFVVARVLSLIIPMVTIPILGRALGPHGMGLLAYVQAQAQFLCIVIELGFSVNSITVVSRIRDDRPRLGEFFWSLIAIRMLALLVGMAVVGVLAWVCQDHQEARLIMWSGLMLCGVALTPSWLYQGVERIAEFSFFLLSPKLMTLPFIAMLVKDPSNVEVACVLVFFGDFLSGLVLFVYALGRMVPASPCFKLIIGWKEWKRSVQPWMGNIIEAAVIAGNIVLIKQLAGLYVTGIFSAADRLIRVAFSLFHPVVSATQAHVTRLWDSDPPSAARLARKIRFFLLLGACLVFLGCQFFAETALGVVFGQDFRAGGTILRIESVWLIAAVAGCAYMYFYFMAKGYPHEMKWAYRVSAGCHVLAAPLLTWMWSATGLAVAVVISQILFLVMLMVRARHLKDINGF